MGQTYSTRHDAAYARMRLGGGARNLASAMPAGEVECEADDAPTALHGGQLQAVADVSRLAVLDSSVDVLLVFADYDQVHVRVVGRDEGREGADWPNICEEPELLANCYVERLMPATLWCNQRAF
jgi:hypothetical protein